MERETKTVVLTPDEALEWERWIRVRLGLSDEQGVEIVRRTLDARHTPRIEYRVMVGEGILPEDPSLALPERLSGPPVIVVGAGPAGLFAALGLAERGIASIVVDRGADFPRRHVLVRAGRLWGRDEGVGALLWGLGGAGAYSDGKLHTRKRGAHVSRVLRWLSHFDAGRDWILDAHPHVGSNRLPGVVGRMRTALQASGVQFLFDTTVSGLRTRDGHVTGVETSAGSLDGQAVILAVGNNARPLFSSLRAEGVALVSKPLAVGVRVEHPRPFIDGIQFGRFAGHPALGAARYSFAFQTSSGRGVYSFCMCPGGYVLSTPPEAGHLAVNGMSFSTRSSPWSNCALVVTVGPQDWTDPGDSLGAMEYQRDLEVRSFEAGGGGYAAPAQRVTDFLSGCGSGDLPVGSYTPRMVPADLCGVLPSSVIDSLKEGLLLADRSMPGYISRDAVLVGSETLTSSPVQFPRDGLTLQSVSHPGLYPCGEGSGWAGGITSSAADGLRVAECVAEAG
jgi:hypothetical protein